MVKKLMTFEDEEELLGKKDQESDDYVDNASSGYDLDDDGTIPKLEELKAMGKNKDFDDGLDPIGMKNEKRFVDHEFIAMGKKNQAKLNKVKIIDEQFDDGVDLDDEPDFLAVDYDFDYDDLKKEEPIRKEDFVDDMNMRIDDLDKTIEIPVGNKYSDLEDDFDSYDKMELNTDEDDIFDSIDKRYKEKSRPNDYLDTDEGQPAFDDFGCDEDSDDQYKYIDDENDINKKRIITDLDDDSLSNIKINYFDEYDKNDEILTELRRIADALEKIANKL